MGAFLPGEPDLRAGDLTLAIEPGAEATLSREEIDSQVGMLTELPEPAASALARWVLEVACHVHEFLEGFRSVRDGARLSLTWHGRENKDIAVRWAP